MGLRQRCRYSDQATSWNNLEFWSGQEILLISKHVQTDSGAHQLSPPMGTEVLYRRRGKEAEA
jgi:hypothetical protein